MRADGFTSNGELYSLRPVLKYTLLSVFPRGTFSRLQIRCRLWMLAAMRTHSASSIISPFTTLRQLLVRLSENFPCNSVRGEGEATTKNVRSDLNLFVLTHNRGPCRKTEPVRDGVRKKQIKHLNRISLVASWPPPLPGRNERNLSSVTFLITIFNENRLGKE